MFETKNAIANGSSEIDMVINIGFLKDGRYEEVEEKIKAAGNHYDMIRGNKEDSYLTYFIKHYKEDMKKYFLENTLELSAADTIYTVCCEGVPAGVLAGKKEGDALEISFDYTTPTYRDCSAGRFLYAKLAEEGYKKFICKKVTEGHKSYLEKMGFVKENGVYVKNA